MRRLLVRPVVIAICGLTWLPNAAIAQMKFEPPVYYFYGADVNSKGYTDPNLPSWAVFSLEAAYAKDKTFCEQNLHGRWDGPHVLYADWWWKTVCTYGPYNSTAEGKYRRYGVCGALTNMTIQPEDLPFMYLHVTSPRPEDLGWMLCKLRDQIPPKNVGCWAEDQQKTAGNPLNVAFANKCEQHVDYAALGGSRLRMERTYNSAYYPASTGQWAWSFDTRLRLGGINQDLATVERSDGRAYSSSLRSGAWVPDADVADRLTELLDGGGHRIGWRYQSSADDSYESYDIGGKLTRIQYRDGSSVTMTYSDASTPPSIAPVPGLLIGVADQFGRLLAFTYDSNSRRVGMIDPLGGRYVYGYGSAGDLVSVQYPDGKVRSYLYNESAYTSGHNLPHILTGITDENGQRFATFTYSPAGNPISSEHAGGVNRYKVSIAGSQSTVTDPFGTQRVYTLTTLLGVVRTAATSQPCRGCGVESSAMTYDTNGNVSSRTDFNNKKVCYAYDVSRNLETARAEGLLSTETCNTVLTTLPSRADVRKVSTQWHVLWRLPTHVAEPNRLTTNTYNGDGGVFCAPTTALVNGNPIGVLCKKTVQGTADATGQQGLSPTVTGTPRVWRYTYDSFGRVLTATDPNGKITTTVHYAANDPDLGKRGNVQTITNPLGHVTKFTAYDLSGRPTSIVDPNGTVTTLAYHPRGWLTSRTVGGETTTYDYDGVGQLTKVTQPDGSYVQYTYDGAHRLTQLEDGLGNKIVHTLDAMGNRIREEARDPSGQLARVKQQVFDSLNRLHQTVGAQ